MKHSLQEIAFKTERAIEFIDITDRVRDALSASGVRDGLVTVFTPHTTTAIVINERCARLQQDMMGLLEKIVPAMKYRHDEDTVDTRPNARGHLMSLLLSASGTIPVVGGELALGTWQSIFFIELDGPRRQRGVTVRVIGE